MRNRKRWTLLFVAFLCVIATAAAYAPEAQAVSMNKSNWYKQVVRYQADTTFTKGSKTYELWDYSYYAAVDINQDGTKELLLATGEDGSLYADNTVLVLRYYKGKVRAVKQLSAYAGGIVNRYRKSTKTLTVWTRGSDMARADVYKLNKTSLTRTLRLTNKRDYNLNWNKTINGKRCSEEKFAKYWKKYYDNATRIKYYPIP